MRIAVSNETPRDQDFRALSRFGPGGPLVFLHSANGIVELRGLDSRRHQAFNKSEVQITVASFYAAASHEAIE